jgi:hypothetical protein
VPFALQPCIRKKFTSSSPEYFPLISNLITLMNGLSSPNILDYLDNDGEDIDLMAYDEAEKDYLEKERCIVQPILSKKKPYQPRR